MFTRHEAGWFPTCFSVRRSLKWCFQMRCLRRKCCSRIPVPSHSPQVLYPVRCPFSAPPITLTITSVTFTPPFTPTPTPSLSPRGYATTIMPSLLPSPSDVYVSADSSHLSHSRLGEKVQLFLNMHSRPAPLTSVLVSILTSTTLWLDSLFHYHGALLFVCFHPRCSRYYILIAYSRLLDFLVCCMLPALTFVVRIECMSWSWPLLINYKFILDLKRTLRP